MPNVAPKSMPSPRPHAVPEPERGNALRILLRIAIGIGIVVLLFAALVTYVVLTGPSSVRDAVRADAEQTLGGHRNMARVAYAKTLKFPVRLTGSFADGGCDIDPKELDVAQGRFKVRDQVGTHGDGQGRLWCDSTEENRDHPDNLVMEFAFKVGDSKIRWNDDD